VGNAIQANIVVPVSKDSLMIKESVLHVLSQKTVSNVNRLLSAQDASKDTYYSQIFARNHWSRSQIRLITLLDHSVG